MPNFVTNQITFEKSEASAQAFRRMVEEMCEEGMLLGSFDFNKLIPMPEELSITSGSQTDRGLELYRQFVNESTLISARGIDLPDAERQKQAEEHLKKWTKIQEEDPETWSLGEKAYQNIQKYGCPTWYEWCYENWGTKWNACHYVPLHEGLSTLQFDTAWSDVRGLIKLLSEKYPDQRVRYRWADEDIGSNVGECVFQNGEVISENIPQNLSREAFELSAEILGVDLAEYNLYLTKDRSTYKYMPDGPVKPKTRHKNKAGREE